jgi:coproporphyrinogen III oxidase-like Fe-S oxidoreductase
MIDARLIESIARVLSGSRIRRARDRLGGSHTVVTYPPLDALNPVPEGEEEPFEIKPIQGPLNYYFHIAFCEHICDFCHYTKTRHTPDHPSSEAKDYIAALEIETERRRGQLAGANLASIYVGGGTPTALELPLLERVMAMVASLGTATPRICVETSPITMAAEDGREKLQLLLEAGVNRISIGVQTFDEDLLPDLRRHDLKLLLGTLDMLTASPVSLNIDLIQDLTGQTRQSIENDLVFVDHYRPEQVTWYLLRLHAPSSMAKRSRPDTPFPISDLESALRRAMIIEGMEGLGYRRQAGGRFTLGETSDTYKVVRGGVDSHLLGLGVSAYSHGWDWFFRNVTHTSARLGIREYIARIQAGRTATAWATRITDAERFAGQLCQLSREHVPAEVLAKPTEQAEAARETITLLVEAGLMDGDDQQGWSPTRVGTLFEEEIASLFYSNRVRARLNALNAYWIGDVAAPTVAAATALAAAGA